MAQILFISQGPGNVINTLAGSGLGFYGSAGFGASVAVNAWQATTYVTDSTGTLQGPQCHNTQYITPSSVILDSAVSGVQLPQVPNYMCPLNVRFTHTASVNVQNAKAIIFDRSNTANAASGVTTQLAQAIHPDTVQNNNGSGNANWSQFDYTNPGSGLPLAASPGTSGFHAGNGSNSTYKDTQHDWYLMISGSPDSVGSKNQYGLWVYLEYL